MSIGPLKRSNIVNTDKSTSTGIEQQDRGQDSGPKNNSNHIDQSPKRPVTLHETGQLNTSVRFMDTQAEGRPSIYLFIFVNPLSGDCKGEDLVKLPIQHFRLRRFPQVQVEIHNILDDKDRTLGLDNVKLVEEMAKAGQLPSLDSHLQETEYKIGETVRTRHIHVWSAGGDGTVMSVFELLVSNHVNLDSLFFSCIPFGTGNDFSQVLGWGRTTPHVDILGKRLLHLEQLITERLQSSEAARLDIWEIEMSAYSDGYVRLAGPKRKDGHDVLEISQQNNDQVPYLTRKMSNYMSIGVQGYVGSGFERHRAGNRLVNMLVYTIESAKWVFWRRFPSVTSFIAKIINNNETVLLCDDPDEQCDDRSDNIPKMIKHPIDLVIQNIPHIWGREVDLWGKTKNGLDIVENRRGFTDPNNWSLQLANDGKLEMMAIENMTSYIKELANIRENVRRVGQFGESFEIIFRRKSDTRKSRKWFDNKYKKQNVICIMCDGEFYVLKNPKSLKIKRYAQVWTLGRHDEKRKGRLVVDEQLASTDQ
ncbi:hypothetical protein G6F70_008768 [Rhizopus microsporus]|uniref:diacylglycerol kinase (ATP) n=2 Tax=Rhizopus TaxID=4842 RepID=A0A367J9Y3_RHIAZ|nr:hypothetical protein G6F71_008725 [Rhizopus microsporus]RCH86753.1 hypothetical protein CU097_004866 [Rhizopus azygosporus]KAG1194741.1 hypothetical protein G6F70_008768 [Rhizopus microsporus]KAG1206615.1 hypothetical protein G6F69_008698 [Rhizopus microsporus]KAG1227012.1 hypothetical protein G6F67_008699 [Rhizopus microsporus]